MGDLRNQNPEVQHIRVVAVNDCGRRIGATHHNATISEELVDLMRDLHDTGWGYRRIGRHLGIRFETVARICRYERRGQSPHGWKRVRVQDGNTQEAEG